ncbi:protease SohB [Allohahella sp. A8]|uniref:protease SohB n=1 Tax=Allohahella sp. A8 TaxID=3141461 RepID=UPI000C099FE2|nr:protease SohB [Hahellaceae bacterium]
MEFLLQYGLFLAKTVTLVAAFIIIVGSIVAISQRQKDKQDGHLRIKNLNDRFDRMRRVLEHKIHDELWLKSREKVEQKAEKRDYKARKKEAKLAEKAALKALPVKSATSEKRGATLQGEAAVAGSEAAADATGNTTPDDGRKRVYVLDFDGDIKASEVDSLREAITAVLTLARPIDEVVVRLESPGGMVHSYGLAASQLGRIKARNIPLTVCVDKVAASGGYLMACLADKIVAAPFAIIGSIGVVAQVPNVHRLLKKHDIDVEVLTAGQYKRTLTILGENTEQGRAKFLDDLHETHVLFKEFVSTNRPVVDIEEVSKGEIWYGQRAIDKKLIDEILTSDDYLQASAANADVYQVSYEEPKNLAEKFGIAASVAIDRSWTRLMSLMHQPKV